MAILDDLQGNFQIPAKIIRQFRTVVFCRAGQKYRFLPKGHKMGTKSREIDDFRPFGDRPNACPNRGVQVLDGVVDVFFQGDALVIAVLWRLPVLFRALLGDLRRGEHGVGRQHVKGIGRGGLFAAHGVGLDGYVGLYAQDYVHSASSNL